MSTPKISLILPIYNVEKYIRNSLDSLLKQSYTNWEAILVDDGSPDNCPVIIEEYAGIDKRFITVHRKNGGLSAARNSGLALASGDFIAFLDSDDFLHQDFLRDMIDLSIKYDADIVQCGFVYGTGVVFPAASSKNLPKIKIYDNHSIFTSYAAKVTVWGKIYKKNIVEGIRFREGLVNEDDFYTWRAYYNSSKIVVTSAEMYYYTKNESSIMSNLIKKPDMRFLSAYNERILFFEKEGAQDLVQTSRIQLMKALVLLISSPALTKEEKNEIMTLWLTHKDILKKSGFILPVKLKILFTVFPWFPTVSSKLSVYFYTAKEQ